MKVTCVLMISLVAGGLGLAEEPGGGKRVGEWKWSKLTAAELPGTLAEDPRLGKVLRVERTEPTPQSIRLANWKNPEIKAAFYAVRGQVRHDDVEGAGYLEMWNDFGAAGRFFTRTMGQMGPMRTVSGTSPWRAFYLPFNATGVSGPPSALEINLVLPGKGVVEIGDMELLVFADAGAMWAAMGLSVGDMRGRENIPWFVTATAGLVVGAIGVSVAYWWIRRKQSFELRRMRARDMS